MDLFGTLFGKSKSELEEENRMLRRKLSESNRKRDTAREPKKVLYQCRYCGYKSIRNATDGAPTPDAHCAKHPRGWCKGPHSWQRTFL